MVHWKKANQNGANNMENIILIGMPGTGKSTVGVILAKRLGYDFLDTDILLARTDGRPLARILDESGIDAFLHIEEEVGRGIHCRRTVIATGGSMVFSQAAMDNLKDGSVTVWLETPLAELERRLRRNSRHDRGVAAPESMTLEEIYAIRKPLYEKYSDIRISCSGTTEDVVNAIRTALPAFSENKNQG